MGELNRLDTAVYAAIARTPTPGLDEALGRLSRAADFSKLWLGSASALAVFGGEVAVPPAMASHHSPSRPLPSMRS